MIDKALIVFIVYYKIIFRWVWVVLICLFGKLELICPDRIQTCLSVGERLVVAFKVVTGKDFDLEFL